MATEHEPLVGDERHGEFDDTVDVVIWFRDKKGLHLTLQGGEEATTENLFNIVVEKKEFESDGMVRQLPPGSDRYFSVWLCSSLLDLRLKKDHIPFQIAQLWDDFCETYTDASASLISRDEPVVMVQRNVFLTLEDEMKIDNEDVLFLLYQEAKFNVTEGRYPMSLDDYGKLAGIDAAIEYGFFNDTTHTSEFYKSNLKSLYPEELLHKSRSWLGTKKHDQGGQSLEDRVKSEHLKYTNIIRDVNARPRKREMYKDYLKICWSYPFYGGAFFEGLIQKPRGKVMSSIPGVQKVIDIHIVINTDGVGIIDRISREVILAVPFVQLCWDLKQTEDVGIGLPCLLLQFPDPEDIGEGLTKILQVYSKQARMMDALIATCVGLKKQTMRKPALDEVDGPAGDVEEGGKEVFRNEDFCRKVTNKLNKLTLTTYDNKGKKIPKKKKN